MEYISLSMNIKTYHIMIKLFGLYLVRWSLYHFPTMEQQTSIFDVNE